MEKVRFRTKDGVTIIGNYFKPLKGHAPAFLLLHMMPSTRDSWNAFASLLQKEGFAALAIDLRGHGESIERDGKRIDYRDFRDEEHRESMNDIEAAKEFLKQKGADTSRLALAGASIGANLALWQGSIDKDVKLLVLLSPGLDYRGIKTPGLAQKYSGPMYILSSEGDTKSGESGRILYDIFPGDKTLNAIPGTSHGTDIFIARPELMDGILGWIISKFK